MAKSDGHVVVVDYTPADGGEYERAATAKILKVASDKIEQQQSAAMELKAALEEADGGVTDAEEKQYAARELKRALEAACTEAAEPSEKELFGAEFFRGGMQGSAAMAEASKYGVVRAAMQDGQWEQTVDIIAVEHNDAARGAFAEDHSST